MKTVKVDRARWSRGTPSSLLDCRGKSCVQGQVYLAYGATEEHLLDQGMCPRVLPRGLPSEWGSSAFRLLSALPEELSSEVLKQLRDDHPELCTHLLNDGQVHIAVSMNDSEESDAKKEQLLTELLGSWGVELEFTGEGLPGGSNEP